MKIDRQQIILFIAKYFSYLINTLIVLAVVAGVAFWIHALIDSAKMTHYN